MRLTRVGSPGAKVSLGIALLACAATALAAQAGADAGTAGSGRVYVTVCDHAQYKPN